MENEWSLEMAKNKQTNKRKPNNKRDKNENAARKYRWGRMSQFSERVMGNYEN